MNCPKCGKEALDTESSYCAYCGVPFSSKLRNSELTTGAGILALIAATFSGALGTIGLNAYQSYISYYSAFAADTSNALGFLSFGAF